MLCEFAFNEHGPVAEVMQFCVSGTENLCLCILCSYAAQNECVDYL